MQSFRRGRLRYQLFSNLKSISLLQLCPPTSCICIAAPPPAEDTKESREGGGIKYHV